MGNIDFDNIINSLEKVIKYNFKDKHLLLCAATHSSYSNESKQFESNERLEFLGDTVLSIVISEYLFFKYPQLPEGELTKMRAAVVCEQTIYNCAHELGFGEYLLLGKGEELSGGRYKTSLLCDVFEAVTGAIYIDGGINEAKEFLLRTLASYLVNGENRSTFVDYKTNLQELLQKNGPVTIAYELDSEYGPEHDKTFKVSVWVNGQSIGIGKGKTKKEAEQNAACNALNCRKK